MSFGLKFKRNLKIPNSKSRWNSYPKKKYKVDVDVSNSGSKKATRDLEQLAYEATHTQTVFGKAKEVCR